MNVLILHEDDKIYQKLKTGLEKMGHQCFYAPHLPGAIYIVSVSIEDHTPINVIFAHSEIKIDEETLIKEQSPETQIIRITGKINSSRLSELMAGVPEKR